MKPQNEYPELPGILARLQQFIDRMDLSIYQVNKEVGLSKGLLSNAIAKKQGLTTSTLEALLNTYPQLNANWLIVGRGEMLLPDQEAQGSRSALDQHLQNLDQLQAQCIDLIKTIQLMKQNAQAAEDARLLEALLKT